ncbi:MAG TPA: peptidase, partial [Bryobacteraceae bacterium]|nr:peptidase [Bryobacteraceae bacterium]
MNRVLYREWFPQIMYNHHQTGPRGAVIFVPPFRDPFNYNFDPLIPLQIQMVGTAMHSRFVQEGKPGSGMRGVASYSTWYNGGLRTTTYFHNMIGILTEIIGSPTPAEVPLIPERQLPTSDLVAPIAPQKWHYRRSIDYSMTANRAVLDYASRYRETILFNIYRMGQNSIERGNRDSWTVTPKKIEALRAAAAKMQSANRPGMRPPAAGAETPSDSPSAAAVPAIPAALYEQVLHSPESRDPRGFIISADQPDFPTAIAFANTLIKNGVAVHRARQSFQVAGKSYPTGSLVVKSAQAFRPHVIDMFEPQDHPNDFRFPGGPPIQPYDTTGWTLAYQMGIQFDRVLEGFDGPFEKVQDLLTAPPQSITGPESPSGYLISHRINRSFTLVNRLLKENSEVYWLKSAITADGQAFEPGAVWIPHTAKVRQVLTAGAKELGVPVLGSTKAPESAALRLRPVRIGLVDQYGGSMPSGWTRLIFEQFEFPFEVVYPPTLDNGEL